MSLCTCNISLGNTGKANCEPISGVIVKLIFVRKYADDGTRNSVTVGDIINESYLTAKLNETDASKRWYPSRQLVSVADERADSITESIDGIDYIIDQGVRTFSGMSIKTDSVYLSKISRGKCGEFAVFGIDSQNRLIGEISEDGNYLYPLSIENGTFNAKLIKSSYSTIQKTLIEFAYDNDLNDFDLRLYQCEADLVYSQGLLDVNAKVTAVDEFGFTVSLTLDYGYANSPQRVTDWVLSDFVMFDITNGVTFIPDSLTENNGVYSFVVEHYPTDRLISIAQKNPEKNGFELFTTVVIPADIPVAPEFVSASISGDVISIDFDILTSINGITGITLASDGGALSVTGYISGSETDTINLHLDRTPLYTETITLSIDSISNLIYSVYGGIHFEGITSEPVFFDEGLTPYVNFNSYVNDETYVNLD